VHTIILNFQAAKIMPFFENKKMLKKIKMLAVNIIFRKNAVSGSNKNRRTRRQPPS
jgi:hypothetical protein